MDAGQAGSAQHAMEAAGWLARAPASRASRCVALAASRCHAAQGTYQAAPYDAYAATGSHQNTPPYSASPMAGAYAAPAYTAVATDYSSASAAAFHGAQGAYTGAASGQPRNEQQL
jgi:hypothetical protein